MFTPSGGDFRPPDDEIKLVKCKMCGKDVPCNANYPVSQITCTVCYIGAKLRGAEKRQHRKEQERGANLDEPSY